MTEELLNQLKNATTKEEALRILKENNITLTDDDLQAISGGIGILPNIWEHIKDAAKELAQDAANAQTDPVGMVINHNMVKEDLDQIAANFR